MSSDYEINCINFVLYSLYIYYNRDNPFGREFLKRLRVYIVMYIYSPSGKTSNDINAVSNNGCIHCLLLWLYNSVRILAATITVFQSFRSWILFSQFVTSSVSKSFLIPSIYHFLGLPLEFFAVGCHLIAVLVLVVSAFRIA